MTVKIYNGTVVTPTGEIKGASLYLNKGKITHIGDRHPPNDQDINQVIDASGCIVLPGFIDIHIHGGNGSDTCDQSKEAIDTVRRYHAQHGTTSLLLTTRTLPHEELLEVMHFLGDYIDQLGIDYGANVLGIHLEGPFISKEHRGAQNPEHIQPPSLDKLKSYLQLAKQHIKLVTLAPELPGAESLIRYLYDQGIVVSAGHSGASYEQMEEAITWGVRHATHVYNGMKSFHHRDPRMLASIWMNKQVTTEVILDLHHCHPSAARLLLHNKGLDNVVLITDAVLAAGLEDGEYESGDNKRIYVKGGIVRLAEGNLAGSSLTMDRAFSHAIQYLGVSMSEASQLASLGPARVLGIEDRKGSIEVGKDADLVVMNQEYEVVFTIVGGRMVYRKNTV